MGVHVESRGMFGEDHGRAVFALHVDRRRAGGVHGDSADFAYLGKGKDVCDRCLVIVDGTKVWEITDHVGILITAVGDGANNMRGWTNVAQHAGVVEDRNG